MEKEVDRADYNRSTILIMAPKAADIILTDR